MSVYRKIRPSEIEAPTHCPLPDPKHPKRKCAGTHFQAHELNCRKPVRDTRQTHVVARRHRCLKCQRTFRVYPTGVSRDQQSDTLKGLSVLLYVLGLSDQGVADLLDALEYPLAKSTVYENVQAAGERAIELRKAWLQQQAGSIPVLSMDFTHVKLKGENAIVAVATAILTGQPLDFEILQSESTLHAERWIRKLAHTLGAQVLVTDDAYGLKTVAEDLGLAQQICRAHVNRNVYDLIAAVGSKALEHLDPIPWELQSAQSSVDQFLEDLQTAESVLSELPHNGQAQPEQLVTRYQAAPPPSQGHRAEHVVPLSPFGQRLA